MPELSRTRRFELLVMPHLDAAYNLARWLVRDRADAEDVVQEAMLRAYKFLDGCRDEGARSWVLRIIRNACYDWLHDKASAPVRNFADLNPDDADGADYNIGLSGIPVADPETILLHADQRRLIDALIAALPPDYREVVVLRDLEELSYQEIAQIIGIPQGTVMSRLSRARGQLAKAWRLRNAET